MEVSVTQPEVLVIPSSKAILYSMSWPRNIVNTLELSGWVLHGPCNLSEMVEVAQLIDRPTETPGAVLTRVRVPGATRDFLPESASSGDSPPVSLQPTCVIACINICAHVKNPKHWQPYHCLDERKYYTHVHWQEWVALLLWLLEPYPSKTATRISRKGQRSTKNKKVRDNCWPWLPFPDSRVTRFTSIIVKCLVRL